MSGKNMRAFDMCTNQRYFAIESKEHKTNNKLNPLVLTKKLKLQVTNDISYFPDIEQFPRTGNDSSKLKTLVTSVLLI